MFIEVWGMRVGDTEERNHALFASQMVAVSEDHKSGGVDIHMSGGVRIMGDESYDKVMKKLRKAAKKDGFFGGVFFG